MNEPTVAPEPTTRTENPKFEVEVESKHIVICKVLLASKLKRKTNRYVIFNKRSHGILGEIYWNGPWRQYCFYPEPQCVWSTSCLDIVVEFIKKINTEHRDRIRS